MPAETEKKTEAADSSIEAAYGLVCRFLDSDRPEPILTEAIDHTCALLELIQNNEAAEGADLSEDHDLSELRRGAELVLQKLHFNNDNNLYMTLGLSDKASAEEVHERWKRFISIYHPDRQKGNAGWYAEAARKVNEAYNTLKDPRERTLHDRYLAELYLRKRFPDEISGGHRPAGGPVQAGRSNKIWTTGTALRAGIFLVIASVVLAVYHRSGPLSGPGQTRISPFAPAAPLATVNKVKAQPAPEPVMPATAAVPSAPRAGELKPADEGKADRGIQPEVNVPASGPDPEIRVAREEAADMLDKYARAYSGSDLRSLMSLMSMSVSENSLTFREMHRKYSELFSDRINYYNISNIEIRTEGLTATASAYYSKNCYMAKEDRWVKRSGRVIFRMAREDGVLRIVSITYET
jgi:DnaJ-domain-containing protein 1